VRATQHNTTPRTALIYYALLTHDTLFHSLFPMEMEELVTLRHLAL